MPATTFVAIAANLKVAMDVTKAIVAAKGQMDPACRM